MNDSKKTWVEPMLEQIDMVDTAVKPGGDNEGSPSDMPMTTGGGAGS